MLSIDSDQDINEKLTIADCADFILGYFNNHPKLLSSLSQFKNKFFMKIGFLNAL